MGDLTQLYTVRKAWSVVWHQLMRRTATFTGLFAARTMLKLRPSTFASRYVQLFTGFATTGAMHAFGALAVWGHENGEMAFFLGQASAIMVEDHVIELGKALGFKESRFWKVVGFVWVVLWFSVSLQWWVGLSIEKGALVLNRPWDPFGLDAWLRNKP